MADTKSDAATKANGLSERFQKRKVLLCLMMATKTIAMLEQLNSAPQAKLARVSEMVEAVNKSSKLRIFFKK